MHSSPLSPAFSASRQSSFQSFQSLPNETLINIAQYLTLQEMHCLSSLIKALTQRLLGQSTFAKWMLMPEHTKKTPFLSSVSSIPFIGYNLLRRNNLTLDEFFLLSVGIRKRIICSHPTNGIFNILKHSFMHRKDTCPDRNQLIETIKTCFCSRITNLDWRENALWNLVPVAGLIDEHGFTPFQVQILRQYMKMFPNVLTVALRGYHPKTCPLTVCEEGQQKFFISECSENLIYSIYTDKHYTGLACQYHRYDQYPLHTWISFSQYYQQFDCMGAITLRCTRAPSDFHITPPPYVRPGPLDVSYRFLLSSHTKKIDDVLNQFANLIKHQPRKSIAFEDYVIAGTDLKSLQIFIQHVSADIENCKRAAIEFNRTRTLF